MKLKIGILGTRGIPNNYGGFEQFAQYLSVGLVERGHEVAVYNSDQHLYQQNEWKGVQIIHCRDREHKIGTTGQFFYDLNCIRDASKRDFDILLHLGYTSDSVWWRKWPKKTINIVNMDGLEWKRAKYNQLTRKFLKWAEALAAKNAQSMIADSPAIKEYIYNKYGKEPVYIPYPATVFENPDSSVPAKYRLDNGNYLLLVARMEPENNIEMIIQGFLASGHADPLVLIGNVSNSFGKYLTRKYNHASIRFVGPVYDQSVLNDLRYYSSLYFHGHSSGGTNPSLLEAMGCGCTIAAHENVFNKTVLQEQAVYFSTAEDIARIINEPIDPAIIEKNRELNKEKIRTIYNPAAIIGAYEELMIKSCQGTAMTDG